ncbi:hypothetical protein ACWF99_23830 [Nocardia sp. NPDC055002]
MLNIFDGTFNGMARSELYRAQIAPELFPHEKPMRIENWSAEEREAYCGIYASN